MSGILERKISWSALLTKGCVSEGTAVALHLQRPSWSSVLYLGDIGGPIMVLDQARLSWD